MDMDTEDFETILVSDPVQTPTREAESEVTLIDDNETGVLMPDSALAINLEAETSFDADMKAAVAASLNLARMMAMKESL